MIKNNNASWHKNIRYYIYGLITIISGLASITLSYYFWQNYLTNKIQYTANNYHLASTSHYLKAIIELHKILNNTPDFLDMSSDSQTNITQQHNEKMISYYFIQRELELALSLQVSFADKHFDTLTNKLKHYLTLFEKTDFKHTALSNMTYNNIKGMIITIDQLVRLHFLSRNSLLLQLQSEEKQYTQLFIFFISTIMLMGIILIQQSLHAIDEIIHQRKKMENKLLTLKSKAEENEEKFKSITNQSTEGITVADLAGNYIYVNSTFCEMIGYSESELLTMSVFDVKAPEQDTSSFERSKNTDEGLPIHVILQRKDGSKFIAEVIGKKLNIAKHQCVMGTIRDISEKIRSEKQIRTLYQAIDQSPIIVIITNINAEIEFINQTFERITGYTLDDVRGKNPSLLQHIDSQHTDVYSVLWDNLTKGKTWRGELLQYTKKGEKFYGYTYASPVLDEYHTPHHYLLVIEDITLRKQQELKILQQAHFDTLTSLPNRFLSLDRLKQLLKNAKRNQYKAAVLFLDLDGFKKINDSLGHDIGDKLLIEASKRLQTDIRSNDTVGRLGGDEFIILLNDILHPDDAGKVAEALLDQFRQVFSIDKRNLMLTVSIGIALYPDNGSTGSELLRNADSAMYNAKALGRNTYSYFTPNMNKEVSRRLQLEEQLHSALEGNEFYIVYQAKMNIHTGKIVGAEALIRWNNKLLGEISPSEFIPVAEQTGLIIPIGRFVLTQALHATYHWQQNYLDTFSIAINLSPQQFRDPNLLSFIQDTMQHASLYPHSLELEITENVLLTGYSYINEILQNINQLGIHLTMDDFGTGYSSLSYLRQYPFKVIKIDRSFVQNISDNSIDRELLNATIVMAHALDLTVIAEGIETTSHLDYLKTLQCDYGQGYLFGKPCLQDSFDKLLKELT